MYFIGIEVARSPEGIFLSQRKYSLDILTDAGKLGCKPNYTPMEQNHRLAHSSGFSLGCSASCLRYLKGSPRQDILLQHMKDLRLTAFCDSDWAACPLTCLSLTGYLVFLGRSAISRKTKKQHIVSRYSAEAEYRSMVVTMCELKWLKSLLFSLGVGHSKSM